MDIQNISVYFMHASI